MDFLFMHFLHYFPSKTSLLNTTKKLYFNLISLQYLFPKCITCLNNLIQMSDICGVDAEKVLFFYEGADVAAQ